MCEIKCEESELNRYLWECRNACATHFPEDQVSEHQVIKMDYMQQYLMCMFERCLNNGKGQTHLTGDDMWIDCSIQCNRDLLIYAHQATQKPIQHTQYFSENQYQNFKKVQMMENYKTFR